jgi:hypothetical protein
LLRIAAAPTIFAKVIHTQFGTASEVVDLDVVVSLAK